MLQFAYIYEMKSISLSFGKNVQFKIELTPSIDQMVMVGHQTCHLGPFVAQLHKRWQGKLALLPSFLALRQIFCTFVNRKFYYG